MQKTYRLLIYKGINILKKIKMKKIVFTSYAKLKVNHFEIL